MTRRGWMAASALLLLAASVPGQEQVIVRRLSDVVGIREGTPPTERVLYYFEPTAKLVAGDQVEQGSGGQSEIVLSAGGLVSMHSTTHVILRRISEFGDVLEFPLVTTLEARAVNRPLSLVLPGGTRCNLLGTEVYVAVRPGRMQIRNQGGMTITVTGDLLLRRSGGTGTGQGQLELHRGEEVLIPLFDVSGGSQADVATEMWGALLVRNEDGATLERDGDRLHVFSDQMEARLTVGGVMTRPSGARLLIRNPRHVEVAPLPEAPAEAAPIESTESTESTESVAPMDAGPMDEAGGEPPDGDVPAGDDDTEDDG